MKVNQKLSQEDLDYINRLIDANNRLLGHTTIYRTSIKKLIRAMEDSADIESPLSFEEAEAIEHGKSCLSLETSQKTILGKTEKEQEDWFRSLSDISS